VTERLIHLVLAVALALGGCTYGTTRPDPLYAATRPPTPGTGYDAGGAIYQPGRAMLLFEDLKARRVGDVLTVLLVESTDASKERDTATAKETDISVQSPTLFGEGISELETEVSAAQNFKGGGSKSQSNSLSGSISVVVAEVLPNGNLVIAGEKIVALSDEDEFVRLKGIVRPEDILPDNTVLSTRVADARISYGGKGPVSAAGTVAWLAKFFLTFLPF
jgi:flagellar L-ring protein precursor FlgH